MHLRISVAQQRMELVGNDGHLLKSCPISTSRFGLGFEEGSFKTPTGNFQIAAKIGSDAPLGAIFRGRRPTGEIASGSEQDDLVLTRILWLEGLDPENANTRQRFIYIHGTNQEHLIGTPASHGCIRMRNPDIADIFDLLPEGTPVQIT